MSERKFNISINKFIIDKPAQYVGINPATNWIPLELTQQQIIEEIKKGYAYTALFKDNYRKSENFISADFIAVDIDGGFKIEEILDDNYVKTNCSFVYTTPSHTEMSHRFRIVFCLIPQSQIKMIGKVHCVVLVTN